MANYRKEHVLIGAGKLGRGYLADLFNAAGYELIFLEYSDVLVKKMKEQGYYTLFRSREDGSGTDEIKISGYQAYCTETEREKCVEVLSKANTASVHTYSDGFQAIGYLLADAIKKRVAEGNDETLDVLISVNFLNPDVVFRNYILERLSTQAEKDYFEKNIGLIQTLPYRGGYPSTSEMLAADPISVAATDYPELPVDMEAFKGPIPEGVPFLLLDRMSDRLNCKLWTANVRGAILAACGKKCGLTLIEEANADPNIYKCAILGQKEAVFAAMNHFHFTPEEFHKGSRKQNENGKPRKETSDTLDRQLFGLKRKLGRTDRLVGPALACLESRRIPFFLSKALALALEYDNPADPDSVEVCAYVKENGPGKALEKYCGLDPKKEPDDILYQMVLANYYERADVDPQKIQY